MTLVNLNVVKWLALCDAAEKAANRGDLADDLAVMAGRLTTVTPLPHSPPDTALTTSFRWDCTAFALAGALTRIILAPGLLAKAELVRRLLTPDEPEGRVAMRVPAADAVDLSWTHRRDITG